MKKRFGLILGVLCGAFMIGMCASATPTMLVAEGEESSEVAFEEKVYTYEDENGTMTLTLTSETEFTLVMAPAEGDAINGSGTYTRDGNIITLMVEDREMKIVVNDETMTFGEYVEPFECSVVLGTFEHGKIEVDILEGHVGDVVTLNAKHDLFYLVDYVAVNGVNLVEDEEISGLYKFALAEGENKITAKFVVDTELLGEMSVIYEQAMNKDWTNLFSLENVIRVISFILSSGLLIAMVRYFIKDKRIAKNVETSVKNVCNKVVPETTKKVVIAETEEIVAPMFAKTCAYQEDIIRVLGILVKCIALMQEDTPDSKRAILAELANLNIGDMKVIEDARNFIDQYFANKMAELQGTLDKLDEVIEKNKEVANKTAEVAETEAAEVAEIEAAEEIPEEPAAPVIEDDGTQI